MGDENFVKRFVSGDKSALNELYSRYSARVYQFAFSYMKSDSEALDVVQEVFVALWNNRKKLKKDSNIEAYLFTTAKNTIISVFRKRISEKKYLEYLRNKVVQNSIATEDQVNYSLLTEKLNQLIDQLPPQRKRIYHLSKIENQTNQKIAKELKISVKTVEDHMTKARKFLKENLKDYGMFAVLFFEMFIANT